MRHSTPPPTTDQTNAALMEQYRRTTDPKPQRPAKSKTRIFQPPARVTPPPGGVRLAPGHTKGLPRSGHA